MALCFLYDSKDELLARTLVGILRRRWEVWYTLDGIHSGDWESQVTDAIQTSTGVIVLLTENSAKNRIVTDEIRLAVKHEKPLFPFVTAEVQMPLGLHQLQVTKAYGWKGDENHPSLERLRACIQSDAGASVVCASLNLGKKNLKFPNFSFSLSSFETQISPLEGLSIMGSIEPVECVLVSAYDAMQGDDVETHQFDLQLKQLQSSNVVVFLDSGNYEAYRKNQIGKHAVAPIWTRDKFLEAAKRISPDMVFSFDGELINPPGSIEEVIGNIVAQTEHDRHDIPGVPICPIVHLPKRDGEYQGAAEIITQVANRLAPPMIAIPERELGSGMKHRIGTVKAICKQLKQSQHPCPLHVLGTGNPVSILALSAAGAHSFDGLEWCRTVADWSRGHLHHFQHLDFFLGQLQGKIARAKTKQLLQSANTPYEWKVGLMNIEYFRELVRDIRVSFANDQIHGFMHRMFPGGGVSGLFDES